MENSIIKMYTEENKTITEISYNMNIGRKKVSLILKKNNISIDYNRSKSRNTEIEKNTNDIIDMYVNQKKSLNSIAKYYKVNHIVIKRILVDNRILEKQENSTRRGSKEFIFKNMIGQLNRLNNDINIEFFLSLDVFENLDIERIKVLNDRAKRIVTRGGKRIDYKHYIAKFYNDPQFNKIYKLWTDNKNNKWLSPSLDHKIPTSRGGNPSDINNMQFLTWFENRVKCDMTQEEWEKFKIENETMSNYFL